MSKDLTDAQMLEALVDEAIKREFNSSPMFAWIPEDKHVLLKWWLKPQEYWRSILLHPDFARALFGEKQIAIERPMLVGYGERVDLLDKVVAFQYRLQQAVISDHPIKYMYEAVFNAR